VRKFLASLGLIALGGLIMYLVDPDRGRSRRARLADQAEARSRDVADAVSATARYQAGVVKGVAHDVADVFTSDENGYDDEKLRQKVRSEAIGPTDLGDADIEIDVTDGEVSVRGSLSDDKVRRRLLKAIEKVDGVRSVEDQLEMVVTTRTGEAK
jgi:osmotically-inducible protein OsmY